MIGFDRSFPMGPIPRSLLRLDRVVAASVSEWRSCHSLTLAATPEMKKMRDNWHRNGLIKCPGACSGGLYVSDDFNPRNSYRRKRRQLGNSPQRVDKNRGKFPGR